ncbi:MAG: hypothetical protein ACFE9J_05700, partial [Candidatus Hermodarchaeota archaeon]
NIIFYVNDTVGNIASKTLIVRKDIIAPEINIEEPNPFSLFGKVAPAITAEFFDPHLSDKWYQLDNGTITTLNYTWTGIIAQSVWDQVGNGTILIILYANDSLGNLGVKYLPLHKDIIAPKIIINYPNPYDVFGDTAPDIDILFDDNNLHTAWYKLKNETITTLNYTWTGTLEQTVWDEIGNGTLTISFYANDTMSNFGFSEITVIKDLSAPIISTIEPENYAIFSYKAPDFRIYISGTDIYNCWYVLIGEPYKHFFTKTDGVTIISINQTAWDEFGNGTVTIEFYVNDSVGNIGFTIIELRKDIYAPTVTINLPIYEGYWSDPPVLNITYFDLNPDSLWYEIGSYYGSLAKNIEQSIDPIIWDSLEQGKHQLFIFANDTAGNVNDTYVYTVYKDTLAPIIIINSPLDESTSNSPPIFNITCFDPNFDTLWYRKGISNIVLVNQTDQTLDWGIWNDLPEGTYNIYIYANDTFGHLNDIHVLTLYKDTKAPNITINLPNNNTYYNNPPTFFITASDPNIDTLWYKVGNSEIELTTNFQDFDTFIWNSLDQGKFQVELFANDTFGHINSEFSLTLYKDTLAPKVVINSPLNQSFWNSRPILNISAIDPNLESIYIFVGETYSFLTNNTETFLPLFMWQNLEEGEFKLHVFARDSFDQINDSFTLTLFKDTTPPTITVANPIANALFANDAPDFNITVSKFNLQDIWYILLGNPKKYMLSETTGTINQIAWESFGDGLVTIRFYANDTTGNIKTEDVIVRKDITAPKIKINQPINGQVFDLPPTINVSISDDNLDKIWYRIGTMSSSLSNNIEKELDNFIWEAIAQGVFYLYISANDSIGNINDSYYLTLYKDTLIPNIIINSPYQNQEVGELAPQYNLTIIEDNLAYRWYTLDGGLTNITFTTNFGQIDQQIWDEIWETHNDGDLITIRFYAKDTLDHLGYEDVDIKLRRTHEVFKIKNPIGITTSGTIGGILGIITIGANKTKKFKRMNKKQKKKINTILYLSLLLSGLFLLTSLF